MPEGHGGQRSVFVKVVQKQVIGISAQGAYDPKDKVKQIDCFVLLAGVCLVVLIWLKRIKPLFNTKSFIAGNFESKRQRKPTKKLLESNDLDTAFMPKKEEWTPPKKVLSFQLF